ncbi:uncharacterized protein LOC143149402 [Ptiloglossa arizonensis]|uniref:uncharacterized protein LOC143149402 n=1 Tax=Ptiloglossa arizonensis TaxID=3350558 RepID=UPI003FA16A9E
MYGYIKAGSKYLSNRRPGPNCRDFGEHDRSNEFLSITFPGSSYRRLWIHGNAPRRGRTRGRRIHDCLSHDGSVAKERGEGRGRNKCTEEMKVEVDVVKCNN